MGGPKPLAERTATAVPVGIVRYVATEAVSVGEVWVRRGDVVALLASPQLDRVTADWTGQAQVATHGRVILMQVTDPEPHLRTPGARLVPVLPTSTTKAAPSRA